LASAISLDPWIYTLSYLSGHVSQEGEVVHKT
jgi:hypothetical protein